MNNISKKQENLDGNANSKLMKILESRREISYQYHKYLSTPREYYPGEKMYMREVHVVMAIGENGIENVGILSERLNITKGAVSQYLKKLEEKGFVERIQNGEDKRHYSVKLTKKGVELLSRHHVFDKEKYSRVYPLFHEFSEEELELVYRFDQKFKEFTDNMLLEENDDGFSQI